MGYAVAFLKLVERKEIDVPAPTKRVARLYGVDVSTVRGWKRNFKCEPEMFFPDITPEARAKSICREMVKAAKRYRFSGRSEVDGIGWTETGRI
jgi:hypothetical protein